MTDTGRIMIPIFKKFPLGDMIEAIEKGDVIYICPAMAQNFIVGEYSKYVKQEVPEYVHYHFGPSGCLGTVMAMKPLSNHDKLERGIITFS